MQISSAQFKCSSERVAQMPRDEWREFAFIGRSNVGKSSLINMLTANSQLAKVSSTPGKTRLINHFAINKQWYLVDLPGYGYARASKSVRSSFSKIITAYVTRARKLHQLFVLVDVRLEPQRIDLEFINMCGEEGIPFAIVFTKSDKLSATQLDRAVESYKATLREQWEELPPIFITSSEKRVGRDEILDYIDECLRDVESAPSLQLPITEPDITPRKTAPEPIVAEEQSWEDTDLGLSEEEFAESIKQYINK